MWYLKFMESSLHFINGRLHEFLILFSNQPLQIIKVTSYFPAFQLLLEALASFHDAIYMYIGDWLITIILCITNIWKPFYEGRTFITLLLLTIELQQNR